MIFGQDTPPKVKRKANGTPGLALALGGGMARGFAHIGVLKVFEKHGIRPSLISGTSMGAVVAGAYLTGNLAALEDWAMSLNRYRILSYLDLRVRSAGLIGGERLFKLMDRYFKDLNIEDLPHPLITIAADLTTGHEVWLRKGPLSDALRASFALPGIFPPVYLKDRYLIDGALVNPVPVAPCQAMGAHMTIAVDLNADIIGKARQSGQGYNRIAGFDLFDDNDVDPDHQRPFKKSALSKRLFRREANSPSLFGVMISSLHIVQDRLTRSRLAGDPPDIHVKPSIGHIGLAEFEKAEELIRYGEEAAEKLIPDIMAAMNVLLPEHNHHQSGDKE